MLPVVKGRLRSLLVIAIVSAKVEALVAVPERRPVSAFLLTRRSPTKHHLFLETSPLIGGPSWLPLHVKVILEDDRALHRWDFIPLNAIETSTLQRLLSLLSVPAKIRYQRVPVSSKEIMLDQRNVLAAGYDIILEERRNDEYPTTGDDSSTPMADRNEEADRLLKMAHDFCATYREELHLITNNCWTFAIQLNDHLSAASECCDPEFSEGADRFD